MKLGLVICAAIFAATLMGGKAWGGQQPPIDLCRNLPGNQGTIPEGMHRTKRERCFLRHRSEPVTFMSRTKKDSLWNWYWSSGAECIGRHEGGWRSNTGNGYYGRFQANMDFLRGYGRHYGRHISYYRRFGTADNWPRVLQIHMARHGFNARGWVPWSTTAQACGLL